MKLAPYMPAIRKALAEIAWIFIGITLALMFQNWNSARERQRQELNLLTGLYRDLDETRFDLGRDIAANEKGLENARLMIRAFDDPAITGEQFSKAFAGGILNGQLFPRTSAYDSIKTIGMDLISNDTLRKQIADVHELSLARVDVAQESVQFYYRLYEDYRRTMFRLPAPVTISETRNSQAVDTGIEQVDMQTITPNDYGSIRSNGTMKIMLAQSFNLAGETIAIYSALDKEIVEA